MLIASGQDACETPARHQGAWAIKGLSTELELAGIMRGCLGYQTGHAFVCWDMPDQCKLAEDCFLFLVGSDKIDYTVATNVTRACPQNAFLSMMRKKICIAYHRSHVSSRSSTLSLTLSRLAPHNSQMLHCGLNGPRRRPVFPKPAGRSLLNGK